MVESDSQRSNFDILVRVGINESERVKGQGRTVSMYSPLAALGGILMTYLLRQRSQSLLRMKADKHEQVLVGFCSAEI